MARRLAFVGLSGPIAYDYAHSTDLIDPRDFSSPNPILENVSGLLLCYDDLYFLSPHFCPQDMRELPYVHFVTDDRTMVPKLEIAKEQFKEALAGSRLGSGNFEFRRLQSIIDKMTAGQRDRYAIDSHTHAIYLPGSSEIWGASSTALENLVIDIGLASSLGLIGIDVVMNSVAVAAMRADGAVVNASPLYPGWKLAAVSHMVRLRSPNVLSPAGSYHPILDELRAHPHVNSFRDYLHEAEELDSDGEALARQTSELAEKNVSLMARKYLKGRRKFYSLGSVVIGSGLNAIHPGSGALVTAPLAVAEWLELRVARKSMAWSSFVFDATSSQ